jgi:GH15 family glucan-1,4-alpha-glucosidase
MAPSDPTPACLLSSVVSFLHASDSRVQGTLRAVENKLLIDWEFVLRDGIENPDDGLPEGEGAFLACSFWLAKLILQGCYTEARRVFGCLLSRRDDVGLLAEEFAPLVGRMLGIFPQAYSHFGLINSALNLSWQKGPAEERSESEAPSCLRPPNRTQPNAAPYSSLRPYIAGHGSGKEGRR